MMIRIPSLICNGLERPLLQEIVDPRLPGMLPSRQHLNREADRERKFEEEEERKSLEEKRGMVWSTVCVPHMLSVLVITMRPPFLVNIILAVYGIGHRLKFLPGVAHRMISIAGDICIVFKADNKAVAPRRPIP